MVVEHLSMKIQKKAKTKNSKKLLPIDVVCSKKLEDRENIEAYSINNIPNDQMILDVGEKSTKLISDEISKLLWILKSKSPLIIIWLFFSE